MQQDMSYMPTVVQDLLSLLHEDWLPEKRKDAIKRMLMDMVDRMDDMESNDPWQ
tara:strand:- start:24 stop:185 length:162 start_codon:yes stop_codon:yes gene_type:complete